MPSITDSAEARSEAQIRTKRDDLRSDAGFSVISSGGSRLSMGAPKRSFPGSPPPDRPNEIWQANHTQLDLWVVTPAG